MPTQCESRLPPFQSLNFESVSFLHRDIKNPHQEFHFDLGPLSFDIDRPQIVFVTGGNGSGKSTLVKLLCGLYEPSSGDIFWNGAPIGIHNRAHYCEQFSVIHFDF